LFYLRQIVATFGAIQQVKSPMSLTFQPTLTGHSHLRGLVLLRSISIAGQCIALTLVYRLLDIRLAWIPMLATIAALTAINVLSWLRLRSAYPVSNFEIFAQLCIDVASLSVLLYFSGGSTNPFISLYMLPLIITAATLTRRYTWAMAVITTACYSLLMKYYVPLPMTGSEHEHMQHAMQAGDIFSMHVIGMWLGFVVSAIVVAYFVVQMAQTVRERDESLARVREETLRNERIVELGMQAAGAAHEMGSPLSTMLVVIGELKHEADAIPEWKNSLNLLEGQVRGCKGILDKLLVNARENETVTTLPIDTFLAETLDEWQLLRPTARYLFNQTGNQPSPQLRIDPALRAALMNLLNNAADASPENIDIQASWNNEQFTLQIHDHGTGLTAAAAARAGTAFFTTKEGGRGLGLFLANTTLERLGGRVRLFNRFSGGATTEVTLPLELNI
jgi:two-component system sensor histidine kinase RegB